MHSIGRTGLVVSHRHFCTQFVCNAGGDLESFWMPTIKSTAWVVFASEEQAEATFQAVWGKEWPPGNRSRLNPQYVPVDEAFSKVTAVPLSPHLACIR